MTSQNLNQVTIKECNPLCLINHIGEKLNHIAELAGIIFICLLILTFIYNKLEHSTVNALKVIKDTLSRDSVIQKELDDIRKSVNAERVVLGLVHNTSVYAIKYHLLKLSVLHESLKEGVPSLKKVVKDVPLGIMQSELAMYNDQGELYASIDQKLHQDCHLHLNNINVHTLINFVLTYKSYPIGIISVQFEKEPTFKNTENFKLCLNQVGHDIINSKLTIINQLI